MRWLQQGQKALDHFHQQEDTMAKRINRPGHSKRDKDRIRASQLLNRLDAFANGKTDMTTAQVMAARIVIGKVIPDLKSVEVTGDPEKPLARSLIVHFVTPPNRESDRVSIR